MPARTDREVFLVLKEFGPTWSRGGDMAMDILAGAPDPALQQIGKTADDKTKGTPKGFEVGYELFSINGRMRGHGEPIRVKYGERVLFHILNASATEIRSLALPGHTFRVVALDGNSVPTRPTYPCCGWVQPERVSAIVEMRHPGVWTMGDLSDDDRRHGMGLVVEYGNRKGAAQWVKPQPFRWDYTRFGGAGGAKRHTRRDHGDHDCQTERGRAWLQCLDLEWRGVLLRGDEADVHLAAGAALSSEFRNASDDIHPLHLHRHSFELTRIGGKATTGVMKDVVMLGGFQELELDFVAEQSWADAFSLSSATPYGLWLHDALQIRLTFPRFG